LTGINIEASLRLRLANNAALYSEARGFLDNIRTKCFAFDPNAVDWYKWLQGAALEEPIWVLEVSGSRSLLDAQQKLTVFGNSDEDYRNLKSVDKNIVVSLLDPGTNQETLYEATVSDTGHLSGAGVGFDARPYAVQGASARPLLNGPTIPPASIRASAKSWATIGLVEELIGATFELPPRQRWVNEQNEDLAQHLVTSLGDWFLRPDKPLVQVPVPRELFERAHSGASTAVAGNMLESVQRERAVQTPLIEAGRLLLRRKAVRAKRISGEAFVPGKQRGSKNRERE